jgi:hypothetical protein
VLPAEPAPLVDSDAPAPDEPAPEDALPEAPADPAPEVPVAPVLPLDRIALARMKLPPLADPLTDPLAEPDAPVDPAPVVLEPDPLVPVVRSPAAPDALACAPPARCRQPVKVIVCPAPLLCDVCDVVDPLWPPDCAATIAANPSTAKDDPTAILTFIIAS